MMEMRKYNSKSLVQNFFLEKSEKKCRYSPQEKINLIEIEDFSELGKLTALRFIEWLQLNPGGVISLPTGKTPDSFIKWTSYFLKNWKNKEVQAEIQKFGLSFQKPEMSYFHFVQIDEYFPIEPSNENSFAFYINKFYFQEFGLDPQKAQLIDVTNYKPFVVSLSNHTNGSIKQLFPTGKVDLTLRFRNPENTQEEAQQKIIFAVDQFATEYEQKITDLGGIGFFLGGIGPDGHIAFDIKGSDHFSTTRLLCINYATAAACAGSFGGIEFAREKAVISVGLKTITQNPTTTAIIIAAGQGKAQVVKDAVENEPSILYPATALQKLEDSFFYITKDAAGLLIERRYQNLKKQPEICEQDIHQILIEISFNKNKKLTDLTLNDLYEDQLGSLLIEEKIDLKKVTKEAEDSVIFKINTGLKDLSELTFLHTAPHHDDIMLGYLPYIIDLTKNPTNKHHFAIMTSGFNSVSNSYIKDLIEKTFEFFKTEFATNSDNLCENLKNISPENFDQDVLNYLKALAQKDEELKTHSRNLRLLRNIIDCLEIELTKKDDLENVKTKLEKLTEYFKSISPEQKNPANIQKLKGRIREWEEEILWGHFGFYNQNISHMRLGLYASKQSNFEPEFERDVKPILNLLEKLNPDVITVALDPKGTGPDTHYKVLQAVRAATTEYLKKNKKKNLQIWGYRNVWYNFKPTDANIFVPVDLNSLTILQNTFLTCYESQRKASFPSTEYDGPFCDLAQKIMIQQFDMVQKCLGKEFFIQNQDLRLAKALALCFLKAMSPEDFIATAKNI